jgi:hypothetical protein
LWVDGKYIPCVLVEGKEDAFSKALGSSVVIITIISLNIQYLFPYLFKLRAVCILVLKKNRGKIV